MPEDQDTFEEALEGEDEEGMFSKEQLDYLDQRNKSYYGREFKKLTDKIDGMQSAPPVQSAQPSGEDPVKNFNEQATEKLFAGDALGFYRMVSSVEKETQANLSTQQQQAADKTLTEYSDDPLYKEIYTDAKDLAHKAVANGYPVKEAVDYAVTKAKLGHYEQQGAGGDADLEMAGGGRRMPQSRKPKLPPEYKDAAKRDIADGLFKDEADYINSLDPHIRAKYGL